MKSNTSEYTLFDLSKEYPNMVGETRWAVISDLAEQELLAKHEGLKKYRPFILLKNKEWEPILEIQLKEKRNTKKNQMRSYLYHGFLGYVNGETEFATPNIHINSTLDKVIENSESEELKKALNTLTSTQKRRVEMIMRK